MTIQAKLRSNALQAAHASAKALYKVGTIDKATLLQIVRPLQSDMPAATTSAPAATNDVQAPVILPQ